jgi:hypothetical protein
MPPAELQDLHSSSTRIDQTLASFESDFETLERHKIRLGQGMERDLSRSPHGNVTSQRHVVNDYSRDYSMDYRADSETGNTDLFFPRSPAHSAEDLARHFHDFSMQGIDTSLESVEIARGGKEIGTPEVQKYC